MRSLLNENLELRIQQIEGHRLMRTKVGSRPILANTLILLAGINMKNVHALVTVRIQKMRRACRSHFQKTFERQGSRETKKSQISVVGVIVQVNDKP